MFLLCGPGCKYDCLSCTPTLPRPCLVCFFLYISTALTPANTPNFRLIIYFLLRSDVRSFWLFLAILAASLPAFHEPLVLQSFDRETLPPRVQSRCSSVTRSQALIFMESSPPTKKPDCHAENVASSIQSRRQASPRGNAAHVEASILILSYAPAAAADTKHGITKPNLSQ